MGTQKRLDSPFTDAIVQWLSPTYTGEGIPECEPGLISPRAAQEATFAAWERAAPPPTPREGPAAPPVPHRGELEGPQAPLYAIHQRVSVKAWPELTVVVAATASSSSFSSPPTLFANAEYDCGNLVQLTQYAQNMQALWFTDAPIGSTSMDDDDPGERSGDVDEDGEKETADNLYDAENVWQSTDVVWKQWTRSDGASLVYVVQRTLTCATWSAFPVRDNDDDGERTTSMGRMQTCLPLGAVFVGMRDRGVLWLIDIIRLSPLHKFLSPVYTQRYATLTNIMRVGGSGHVHVRLGPETPPSS